MTALPADLGDGGVLRRLRMDDLEELWGVVERERERVGVWMPWMETTRTIDDERTWLESVTRNDGSYDGCGLFVDGRYAGGVGLSPEPFGISGEIGYWIASEHEGRGFVTRAVGVLLHLAFEELRLNRVEIRAGTENIRSRAIPERLGFVREGVARGAGRGSVGFYDLAVYSMLREEWTAR